MIKKEFNHLKGVVMNSYDKNSPWVKFDYKEKDIALSLVDGGWKSNDGYGTNDVIDELKIEYKFTQEEAERMIEMFKIIESEKRGNSK